MELDLGSRAFQLRALAVLIFVAVFVAAPISGLESGSSSGQTVVSVEKEVRAGNLGSSTVLDVDLENGSTFSYERYESHHPLCPEQPDKCGEDSQDPGYSEVKNLIESGDFIEEESNLYRPEKDICMVSRTSFEAC